MTNKTFMKLTPALSRSFWIFHITGWSILMIVQILFHIVVPGTSLWTVWLLYFVLENGTGFSIMIGIRAFYRKIQYADINYGMLLFSLVLFSFAVGMIWQTSYSLMAYLIWNNPSFIYYMQLRMIILESATYQFPVVIGWSILYFGIKFWFNWQDQREETQKAVISAHQAQFQMLRYQLKPNFLFNSLLSIRAILDEDKKTAKKLVTDLSEFLRYSLLSKHNSIVRLQDELEAIRLYLEIEKFRYEDDLAVEYDIDPHTTDIPVLSFLIHAVVENSMQRIVQKNALPIKLTIRTALLEKDLEILVNASGNKPDGTRITQAENGKMAEIEHLMKRIEHVYGEKQVVDVKEDNGNINIKLILKNILETETKGTTVSEIFPPPVGTTGI